ncbi:hypothetical protein J3998_03955 [Thiomicrorhabdus sp. 6S2-11]|uniref:Uncharacterized protein n=1 Tax=Thiomicrorhabdus marina TaxID=2818442 RepID=A0ABS3Q316_9GAMM|nr:hypothetical protein [Thiomicrorhabdus marina]MBO1926720.1 hypothetical protein [Thiomicrorhabdus marina]
MRYFWSLKPSLFLFQLLIISSVCKAAHASATSIPVAPSISVADYSWIAQKIYQNECASKPENLLFWSKKEVFPSLGIGHFIWFPKGVDAPFEQTFPDFLRFVQRQSSTTQIPTDDFTVAPWQSREVFYTLKELGRMQEWQTFLQSTFAMQSEFIVNRFQSKLPELIAQVSDNRKAEIQSIIDELMAFDRGMFALIDYSNFKGLGINPKERYQNKGWGLLQVLFAMQMPKNTSEQALLDAFILAAKQTLKLRTKLASNSQLESTWLEGWFKRLDGYGLHSLN